MSDATAILDNDIEPGDAAENITSKYGRLFVVSGPSGVGKGTVIKQAMSTPVGEKAIVKCVTATTRQPRPGEINNVNYHFFTHSEFQEKIDSGYFLEFATYNGNMYGTPLENVDRERLKGNDVLLEIEVQGGLAVKTIVPDSILTFIAPPSWNALADRLKGRNTETPEVVERRLNIARTEMKTIDQYHYCIINDDLDKAVEVFRAILIAERHKVVSRPII